MTSNWEPIRLGGVFSPSNVRLGPHVEEPEIFAISKYDGIVLGSNYHERRVASAALDKYKVVQPGDWAYSTIHIDEGSIARNTTGTTGVASPMYTIMNWSSDDHDPKYFELLLKSESMLALYGDFAQGSINRRRSLPWKTFSQMEVIVPPLAEQRRIVDLIGALDDAIEAAKIESSMVARLYTDYSRKGVQLSPTDNPVQLESFIASIKSGKKLKTDAGGQTPVFGANGPVGFTERSNMTYGTVVLGRVGAKCGAVHFPSDDFWATDNTLCVETRPETPSRYLYHLLNGLDLNRFKSGSGQPLITQRIVKERVVPDRNPSEVAEFVSAADAIEEASIATNAHAISLRNLRLEMLTALLSGAHSIPESYDEVMNAV